MPPYKFFNPSPPAPTKENPLSLIGTIEKGVKTFASDFEKVYVKLFQAEPAIETTVVGVIGVVAPLVVAVVASTGNEPEALAIAGIISVVKSDLAVVQTTLNAAGAGTANASVKSTLTAIDANLASLLTAGMIKNPATLATVTKDVNSISSALAVIIAAL
jgi:hypothetical protein